MKIAAIAEEGFMVRTKPRSSYPKSRIVRATRTIEELKELLKALDPFVIRLAALAFLLLAMVKVLRTRESCSTTHQQASVTNAKAIASSKKINATAFSAHGRSPYRHSPSNTFGRISNSATESGQTLPSQRGAFSPF